MQNNNVMATEENNSFQFLRVIVKNLFLVILIIVLGTLAGLGIAFMRAKPTYTATVRVMFVAKYSENTNSAGNDLLLAQKYLPNAVDKIQSPLFVADANDIYKGEGKIVASSISAQYGEKSLIFSLSYTDFTEEAAVAKLDAVIESAKLNFPKPEISVAKDATLKEVENKATVTVKSNFGKFILLGAFVGAVLIIGYLFIKEISDTSVRSKKELEELTGISVIACIEDMELAEKSERERVKKRAKQIKK